VPRKKKVRVTVEVEPFRERFLQLTANGTTASDIAERLGWTLGGSATRPGNPDVVRVKRAVGLMAYEPGHGRPRRFKERITYEMAVQLAEALHMDPHEAGV
jgi:hypothetical protein